MQRHLRQLSFSFLTVVLCYGGTIALWSVAGEHYERAFRRAGLGFFQTLHRSLAKNWFVVFEPTESASQQFDVDVVVLNRETRTVGRRPIGTKYHGYTPTCIFLALILGTPMVWRRKLLVALAGSVLVHIWIAFSLVVLVLHAYCSGGAIALYQPGPWVARCVSLMMEVVNVSPVTKYTVPVVIWILVAGKSVSWRQLTVDADSAQRAPARRS